MRLLPNDFSSWRRRHDRRSWNQGVCVAGRVQSGVLVLSERPLRRGSAPLESLGRSKEKWWQEGERGNTRDVDLDGKKRERNGTGEDVKHTAQREADTSHKIPHMPVCHSETLLSTFSAIGCVIIFVSVSFFIPELCLFLCSGQLPAIHVCLPACSSTFVIHLFHLSSLFFNEILSVPCLAVCLYHILYPTYDRYAVSSGSKPLHTQ